LRVAAECQLGERIHFYIPASEYRQSATGRAHLKVHVLDTLLGQAQLERLPSTISGGRRPAILGVVSMASEGSRARARIGGGGWDSSRERASEILEIPEDTPPGLHEISMTVAVRAFRSSIKPEVAELVTANQQLVTLRTTIKVLGKDEHPEGTVPIDRTTRVALEKLLKGSAWTQQATETEGDSQSVWVVNVSPGVYPQELAKPDLPLIYGEIYYVPDRDDEDRPVPRLDAPDEPRFLGTFHTLSTNGPNGPSRRFTSNMTGSSGPLPDRVTIIIRLTPQRARELPVPKPGFSGEVIVYGVRIRKEDDR
jgi:hypothetical protein